MKLNKNRSIVYTKKFNNDLKKVSKYNNFDADLFNSLINRLATGDVLDDKYRDHKMTNKKLYSGANNFHLTPDILVLYKMSYDELKLVRIGSHSSILGNERGNKHY